MDNPVIPAYIGFAGSGAWEHIWIRAVPQREEMIWFNDKPYIIRSIEWREKDDGFGRTAYTPYIVL